VSAGEPVVGLVGAIAKDEPCFGQLVLDREHGRAHAVVLRRQEAHERDQQVGAVERDVS